MDEVRDRRVLSKCHPAPQSSCPAPTPRFCSVLLVVTAGAGTGMPALAAVMPRCAPRSCSIYRPSAQNPSRGVRRHLLRSASNAARRRWWPAVCFDACFVLRLSPGQSRAHERRHVASQRQQARTPRRPEQHDAGPLGTGAGAQAADQELIVLGSVRHSYLWQSSSPHLHRERSSARPSLQAAGSGYCVPISTSQRPCQVNPGPPRPPHFSYPPFVSHPRSDWPRARKDEVRDGCWAPSIWVL